MRHDVAPFGRPVRDVGEHAEANASRRRMADDPIVAVDAGETVWHGQLQHPSSLSDEERDVLRPHAAQDAARAFLRGLPDLPGRRQQRNGGMDYRRQGRHPCDIPRS